MDTQLLEAFIAVAESGSFSSAAERIHITQPAVSKRIAQLEEQLDCRLFDRIARNIALTEAGHALLPRAQQILRDLAEARQAIHDLSGDVAGELRMAISHHIGLHRLPPVLKQFAQQFPGVNVDVDFMDSEVAYDGVLHGRFEVAVITMAPEPHPRIQSREIWWDPLELVVSADHALAPRKTISFEELAEYPAILPGPATYTGRMITGLFEARRLPLKSTMATNYLETIKMMVSVGLGWSMLPATMIDNSLQRLRCKGISLARSLGYIHHREKSLSNAAREFITLLERKRRTGPDQRR